MTGVFSDIGTVGILFVAMAPFLAVLSNEVRRAGTVRRVLARVWREPKLLGLLSGGPDRMVDTIVTELVERGVVRAEYGALAVVPDHRADDVADPARRRVLDAVTTHGRVGLDAVRAAARADSSFARADLVALARLRLIVTRARRVRALVDSVVVTVGSLVCLALGATPAPSARELTVLAVLAPCLNVFVVAVACTRDGYLRVPVSSLGKACLTEAGRRTDDVTEAHRVARTGLHSLPKTPLLAAIQGDSRPSGWSRRPWAREPDLSPLTAPDATA